MPRNVPSTRWSQIVAWAVVALFLSGFFVPLLGAWTGAILGVWFVGTQKPRRGFLWLFALTFLPGLASNWRQFPLTGPVPALQYVAWMLLAAVLGVLPFLFHRLTSPRLPGILSTLPLPISGALLETLALKWLPPGIFNLHSLAQNQKANSALLHVAAAIGIGALTFFVYWFAAVVLWMWNHACRASQVAVGAGLFAAVCVLAAGFGLFRQFSGAALPPSLPSGAVFPWICLGATLALGVCALLRPPKPRPSWANRPELALLQSPCTQSPLQLESENGRETLVSRSGERFPIRNGIPVFLNPQEITGPNRKYNHLYETIGGFYDDTQRVWYALRGMDPDAHFLSYLPLLEIKPGDSVLETSVGTGLNFKYLPRGIRLFGLDLSPEMLANCETNLRRWRLDADLFLGNAESLPFADSSFDVVFHVGGINFFSDRAKAIHEMIRVAKPGRRILIADETEEHVKETYERMPIASGYFKGRKQAVAAPMDLVPPSMQEAHLESLLNGRFYALTFRKPSGAPLAGG
jgi:ubiquinone/menaquinone biosynthesis C-methylase UbiE